MAEKMSQPMPEDTELDQALLELERSLEQLQARFLQVKQDRAEQRQLQQHLSQAEAALKQERSPALRSEVAQLKQKLEELEIALESQLLSWSWVREVFWQAVRFGGIGILIGWLLRAWAS
ncbi:DUF2203 domain-containing protein [filamentous cyanobacterium LEGE 07170]|nr:DUF2203 domain-containing protein [filamentous cyanobacterium LEGE 07170]